jgi:hypothetical protein
MATIYCDCDILPPHGVDYHNKVVEALEADPNQHFVIKDGVVYLVDGEDLLRELNND